MSYGKREYCMKRWMDEQIESWVDEWKDMLNEVE